MRNLLKYILVLTVVLSGFVACNREGRVIPKKKLAVIYADMFVADQWLNQNYRASRMADTMMVYENIFRKYGYDSDDYRASVNHYIQEPDKYARILRQTVLILDDRIAEQKAELRKLKSIEAQKPDTLIRFDFSKIWIFDRGYPRLVTRDSLEYFQNQDEFFILDLKPFADGIEFKRKE